MSLVGRAAANGLGSRLLSTVPGLILVLVTVADHRVSGTLASVLPVAGAVVFAMLGFIEPFISTEGFWRSSEQRERLALAPKRVRLALFVVCMGLMFGPSTVRVAARLLHGV